MSSPTVEKKSLGPKTILYPTPVLVICSYDAKDRPNAMTASWSGICCSQPPCVMVALRKATYTYSNIMKRQAFTVNVPSKEHMEIADYFGMATGRTEDKFTTSGLTAVPSDLVDAPYIQEFALTLECEVAQTIELGLHTQFIGEIRDVKADPRYLNELGLPSFEKIKPFCFAPETRAYYATGKKIGEAFSVGKKLRKQS